MSWEFFTGNLLKNWSCLLFHVFFKSCVMIINTESIIGKRIPIEAVFNLHKGMKHTLPVD